MENLNVIYDESVVNFVVEIFHKNSDVYLSLMKGDKISKLVKKSFTKKGFGVTRIKDKKKLFEMCKEQEQLFEQYENAVANNNI